MSGSGTNGTTSDTPYAAAPTGSVAAGARSTRGGSATDPPPATTCIVLGAQWGDEGKGKIVDLLCQHADIVCRCQVGAGLRMGRVEGG